MRIVVGAFFLGAALGDGFGAFHHEGITKRADGSGGFCLDRIFAFRVIGTAVKNSEAAAPSHHFACFAHGAGNARLFSAV